MNPSIDLDRLTRSYRIKSYSASGSIPASFKINKAASGTKAWKTRLQGNYNDLEFSYLYSPCFDIGGMTNPTLSFSVAMDLEDCGSTMCDAAWVEYSTDNRTWQKLVDTAGRVDRFNKRYQRAAQK